MAETRIRRRAVALGIGIMTALAVAGCGGVGAVPAKDVAAAASEDLKSQNLETESVTCHGDAPAEVGGSVRCTAAVKDFGSREGTAKVTAVDGSTVTIAFTLDGLNVPDELPSSSPST